MNFQDFCADAESTDQQKVITNNTFVISFSNSKDEFFSIDPQDIIHFLEFLIDNYNQIENVWRDVDSRKELLTNYEEKSYREIYKSVGQEDLLKTISSAGRSQTKPLTMVIAKLICYLCDLQYVPVQENTYFDRGSITKALSNVPRNISDLAAANHSSNSGEGEVKNAFKEWLRGKGLAGRTIYSYAETGVSVSDKILINSDPDFHGIYFLNNPEAINGIITKLNAIPEWSEKNRTGNGMYGAAISKYKEFLEDSGKALVIKASYVHLPKPFILLAGLSGTGKTRFVSEQALATRATENNYCLVSVRPDWHEPSDLLGYVSRLGGRPEYVSTKVLNFIISAWKVMAPGAGADGYGGLNYSAEPFWLCLDEMNLAPVEQYFADYLSVLESRKFKAEEYFCEALLDKNLLQDLSAGGGNIQSELGLQDNEGLWQCFLKHGVTIPPNLIVAGTVNMDETTHGFSRKVIDRAFTFDFGEFFPNDFDGFFQPETRPKTFSYSLATHASKDDLSGTCDTDGEKTIAFLTAVNSVLNQTPFELAYRALNELLLQVACFKPSSDAQLQAVWDDFLMAKVLPRVDGDGDKLRNHDGTTAGNLLNALAELLETELDQIWDNSRHDFYREKIDGSTVDNINCRSKTKLQWMQNRLEVNTFTSFWP